MFDTIITDERILERAKSVTESYDDFIKNLNKGTDTAINWYLKLNQKNRNLMIGQFKEYLQSNPGKDTYGITINRGRPTKETIAAEKKSPILIPFIVDIAGDNVFVDNSSALTSRMKEAIDTSIQDAINGGLINAVGNLIQGQLNSGGSAASAIVGGGSGVGDRIHELGIDSSPDGNLNAKVHDPITQAQTGPLNDNVYGGVNTGVDSTPDGNLNNNIHE